MLTCLLNVRTYFTEQAKADSARAMISLGLSPVAEFTTPWVDDMVVPVR